MTIPVQPNGNGHQNGDIKARVSEALDGVIGRLWRTIIPGVVVALLVYGLNLTGSHSHDITDLQAEFRNFVSEVKQLEVNGERRNEILERVEGAVQTLQAQEAARERQEELRMRHFPFE